MAKTEIHKGAGHRKRLREKFLESGLVGFHDYEVIELFLTLATPRKDCKDAAKKAIDKFKTLQGVLEASTVELKEIDGIGEKNIFGIKLIKEAADRYLEKKIVKKNIIKNSHDLVDYLKYNMQDRKVECFKVLFLDAKNNVLKTKDLFTGTINASPVFPREVVSAALEHNAVSVIFAHNHPSGDPKPSLEDIAITKKLFNACMVMGIVVHEHIIIGDNQQFSFADHGLIAECNREYKKNLGN